MNALPGDGMSTAEVFAKLEQLVKGLKRSMLVTRKSKDHTQMRMTDTYLYLQALSRRLDGLSFAESPYAAADEVEEQQRLVDRALSMQEALEPGTHGEGTGAEDEAMAERLEHFRVFIDYLCVGCRQESEVIRKLLALVRRVRPEALRQFGLSQADVSRKLGEQRATVSARELRLYERPLREAGARGLLGNGTRSEVTRGRCAKAQKGNRNRAGGKARERAEDSGNPE